MAKRCKYELGGDEDDWVKKCVKCKHHYVRKIESDTLYCALKGGCRFEEYKSNHKSYIERVKRNESIN